MKVVEDAYKFLEMRCDKPRCENLANHQAQICNGFTTNNETGKVPLFTIGVMTKVVNLCDKHYRKWCQTTYSCIYGKPRKQ